LGVDFADKLFEDEFLIGFKHEVNPRSSEMNRCRKQERAALTSNAGTEEGDDGD
jgi:hypothetical protein